MHNLHYLYISIIFVLLFILTANKLQDKKEEEDMVALYVALIIAGRRTFAQVPTRYKEYVKEDLLALGLDENGDPIQE